LLKLAANEVPQCRLQRFVLPLLGGNDRMLSRRWWPPLSTQSCVGSEGIMRACLETQKLEQLEARMDEIADRVARDRTNAARERTSTHEAQRPSH
jgi:hypothetical protein